MESRFFTGLLAGLCGVLVTVAPARAADFHAPASEPEKALAALLKWETHLTGSQSDDNFFYLTGRPGQPVKQPAIFATKYTDALVQAVRAAEKKMVQQECGGTYSDGEICGLDFDPVACAQDELGKGLQYATLAADDRSAKIALRLAGSKDIHALYAVKKEEKGWRLDGVSCGEGTDEFGNFNLSR